MDSLLCKQTCFFLTLNAHSEGLLTDPGTDDVPIHFGKQYQYLLT